MVALSNNEYIFQINKSPIKKSIIDFEVQCSKQHTNKNEAKKLMYFNLLEKLGPQNAPFSRSLGPVG